MSKPTYPRAAWEAWEAQLREEGRPEGVIANIRDGFDIVDVMPARKDVTPKPSAAEVNAATQTAIDNMTVKEFLAYVKAGGPLPEDDPADGNPLLGQRDYTEDETKAMLDAQEARHQGGRQARDRQALIDLKATEYRNWLVESLGFTAEQAAASPLPEALASAAKVPEASTVESRRKARIAEAIAEATPES